MNKPLINPYTVGPPVMGENFYGRDILLQQVERSLRRTNVVLLQGQRRIGKTSVLRQLAHSLSQEELETSNLVIQIPVFFDIQRYVQDTLPQFQFHLAGAIIRSLEHLKNKSLSIPVLEELEKDPTLFQDKWLPQIQEQLENKELVILVDEFDNFDEQIAPHTMQYLVPFLGQLVSGENWLKWVFTLGRLRGKVSLEYDPIMRSGEEFRLTFLSYDEAYKLIVEPAKNKLFYLPETIKYIYQLTNGQPHLIQAICSQIFEYLLDEDQKTVIVKSVDAVIYQTLESYGSAISSIVSVPPIEEKVLIAIAQLSNSETSIIRSQVRDTLIQKGVRLSIDDLQNAIESLLKWELLRGSSETLQITIKLVEYWLRQNKLIELSQQENLNIQYALAKSRSDFAQKALVAGHYELAIKDYREALEYIPNDIASLKGLAESYRLNNDLLNRIEILKKLHSYDRNNLGQLIETINQYIQQCENNNEFVNAIEQYDFLLSQNNNNDYWQQKKFHTLTNYFEQQIIKLDIKLISFWQDKEGLDDIRNEIAKDFLDDKKSSDIQEYSEALSYETLSYETLSYMNESYSRNHKKSLTNKISELNKVVSELNILENKIKKELENKMDYQEIDKKIFNSLVSKKWFLSKRVEIENAKLENDLKKVSSILLELENAGEELNEKDEEIILSTMWNQFNTVEKIFKFSVISIYICIIFSLIKDWYIKVFVSFLIGTSIIIALIVAIILFGLTDVIFVFLRRQILKIMRKFKYSISDIVNSN
jgi:hypothetical protein